MLKTNNFHVLFTFKSKLYMVQDQKTINYNCNFLSKFDEGPKTKNQLYTHVWAKQIKEHQISSVPDPILYN